MNPEKYLSDPAVYIFPYFPDIFDVCRAEEI